MRGLIDMKKHILNNGSFNMKFNDKILRILALVVAVVMAISFFAALSTFSSEDDDSKQSFVNEESSFESENETVSEVVTSDTETSEANYEYFDKLTFKEIKIDNSEVTNGSLAIIKNNSTSFPIVNENDLKSVYSMKSDVYGLSGNGLYLYEEAILGIDKFIVNFYNEVSDNGLIIDKAYLTHNEADPDKGTVDLCGGYSVRFAIYGSSYSFSDPEFNYLREQAYRYGVIQRYPEDKKSYTGFDSNNTIYRYVGNSHSWYMNYYKLCLEEYIDTLRTNKVLEFKNGIENNKAYVIYYVEMDKDAVSTTISIPTEEYKYTISGDGSRGFVISVEVPVA